MTDKEVGELWARAQVPALESSVVIELIHKLVEERAFGPNPRRRTFTEREREVFLSDALRSFGIDPASWEKVAKDNDSENFSGGI
jgi:hypothetical protein